MLGMEHVFYGALLCVLLVLSGCGKRKAEKKVLYTKRLNEVVSVDIIHKEQSLKEAALSSMRRRILGADTSSDMSEVQCIEARCVDIVVPIQAKPIENYCMQDGRGSICLAYDIQLPVEELLTFFSREMERVGWSEEIACNGVESLLLYKKPGKVCIISVRPPVHKLSRLTRIIITQLHSS